MLQKEFTDNITQKLIARFPVFATTLHINQNDGYINYRSKKGSLTLLISTRAQEITIGFAATPERFDWHTHMDMYGAMSPDEKLKMAVELIENILSGKEKIIHSSVLGYFLTDNIDNIRRYQEKDEVIRILEWGDL